MRRLLAVVALALVALAGCGKDDAKKESPTLGADSTATELDTTISPDTTMEVR